MQIANIMEIFNIHVSSQLFVGVNITIKLQIKGMEIIQ
jgi:hypothetical protein